MSEDHAQDRTKDIRELNAAEIEAVAGGVFDIVIIATAIGVGVGLALGYSAGYRDGQKSKA